LYGADSAFGVEDEDTDIVFTAHAVDSRRTCIAAGCADDVQLFAALFEDVFEEVAEQLQCNVFKRESRSVEKLLNVNVALFDNGGNLRCFKSGIALVNQLLQVVCRDVVRKF
jgi:hypothetical protein